ncbi:MAG: peptidoglycan D,D-transpeptidase FtsI family protein [Actinomycetota bacterium]
MSRPPVARLGSLLVVLLLAFTGIGARLVTLQVRDAAAYEALAREQRLRRLALPADRGVIYDRAGRELALSLPARTVYADPRLVRNPARVARRIAKVLGVEPGPLRSALLRKAAFVYLARKVDLGLARRIEELELPGIGFLEESKRYYPGEGLAAQVLGFVGVDDAGLAGLELEYQRLLAGRPGSIVVEQDAAGRLIPQGERRGRAPVPGRSLALTIDRDIQFHVERALGRAVRGNDAKGGMAVVLDPVTGDVLAMATAPTFDLNRFQETPVALTRNRPVTDMYEPGSVNKVITATGVVEENLVDLAEVLEVPDRYRVGDKWFHDNEQHPPARMTITDVIAYSSNVGTIQLAERLGKGRLTTYLDRFGFGRETGIRFPGEAKGLVLPADRWWGTSMGTIPLGQGIAVTLLQMATVYATVANDGVAVTPRLVRATIDANGRFDLAAESEERRVVSGRTARIVTGMLARAVRAGTGRLAQIPGYWVAGKTGTARKPLEDERGYSEEVIASFIGFAPARDPRVVVAVMLDEPATVYGGIAAAPLFQEITQFALGYLHVPTEGRPAIPPTVTSG